MFLNFRLTFCLMLCLSACLDVRSQAAYDTSAKELAMQLIRETRILHANLNNEIEAVPNARILQYEVARFATILSSSAYEPDRNYKKFIVNDLDLIRSLNKNGYDSSKSELLAYLVQQFRSKVEYCSGFAFNQNPFGEIPVVVKVVRRNRNLSNCRIQYSSYFWTKNLSEFDKDGCPATIKLPPGKYIFRVLVNNKEVKRAIRDIGRTKTDTTAEIEIYLE